LYRGVSFYMEIVKKENSSLKLKQKIVELEKGSN
jgi:hypothetical protein